MKFSKEEIQNSMLLYAVTDRMWLKDGEGLTDVCRKVLENGATFLQIREKDLDENTFEQEAEALKELCASYRVPYVVNDSVEIAMDIDADGVHVGQSDIKGRDIRAMIGLDKILGISAGNSRRSTGSRKSRCRLYWSWCSIWHKHQEKRQKSVAGETAEDQQFCKHSGGSHWRNQCFQSDGACRQRSRRCSGGICHLCSQGSRSGDQRAESAGTENGGT